MFENLKTVNRLTPLPVKVSKMILRTHLYKKLDKPHI